MKILPAQMFKHISNEEFRSLSEDELIMLLYICSVWAPIKPPFSEDDKLLISTSTILAARREAILDRVIQAEKIVSDSGMGVYESLRQKISITVVKKVVTTEISGSIIN
jgi:hypothetical protein